MKTPDASDIAAAVALLAAKMCKAKGYADPREINDGDCDVFAEALVDRVGRGRAVWGYEVDPHMPGGDGHCVAEIDGRYYDSEAPDGVDDIREINYFADCLRIYERRAKVEANP